MCNAEKEIKDYIANKLDDENKYLEKIYFDIKDKIDPKYSYDW